MVRAVNGSTTTTVTSTGTICQRRPTTASTAADASDTAAAPIAVPRRNRGGSQRANTSANAPSTRPASIGVMPILMTMSFTEAMVTEFGPGDISPVAEPSAPTSAKRLTAVSADPARRRAQNGSEPPWPTGRGQYRRNPRDLSVALGTVRMVVRRWPVATATLSRGAGTGTPSD